MAFLGEWLRGLFYGDPELPPTPTSPIFGKRKSSTSQEQHEKKRRRLSERYTRHDYHDAYLYDLPLERRQSTTSLEYGRPYTGYASGRRPFLKLKGIVPGKAPEEIRGSDIPSHSLDPPEDILADVPEELSSEDVVAEQTLKPVSRARTPTPRPASQSRPTSASKASIREVPAKGDRWSFSEINKTPNALARAILRRQSYDIASAAKLIKSDLAKTRAEPEYSLREIEIRDAIWALRDSMERFVQRHVNTKVVEANDDLRRIFWSLDHQPETVKIIGCVASGGPGARAGWEDLFLDDQKKRALANAIIGKVLTEQVFQHTFFGGAPEQLKKLKTIQTNKKNDDGKCSYRSQVYAD